MAGAEPADRMVEIMVAVRWTRGERGLRRSARKRCPPTSGRTGRIRGGVCPQKLRRTCKLKKGLPHTPIFSPTQEFLAHQRPGIVLGSAPQANNRLAILFAVWVDLLLRSGGADPAMSASRLPSPTYAAEIPRVALGEPHADEH